MFRLDNQPVLSELNLDMYIGGGCESSRNETICNYNARTLPHSATWHQSRQHYIFSFLLTSFARTPRLKVTAKR